MSLINEALKKARLEAARRDAAERGVLVPKATAYEPRRRRGRWIGAAAALALGLAVAGGMWLAGRGVRGETGTIAEAPQAPATVVAADAAPAAPPEPEEPTPAATTEPSPAAPVEPAPPPPAGVLDTTDGTDAVPAARSPSAPTSAPPDTTAEPTPPPPTPAETVHVREAPLPGGGSIRLDGIAWSETTPAAVLDGQIVGPGERIHGARVLRVERDRVVLEIDGTELVLRLR